MIAAPGIADAVIATCREPYPELADNRDRVTKELA